MKKSKAVPATLVASLAAVVIAGCGNQRQVRRCVDDQGNILPDIQCTSTTGTSTYRGSSYPHWVYGGSVSGRRVSGYSSTPSSSADIVNSSGSVVRRGFGGGSSSHSSFGG